MTNIIMLNLWDTNFITINDIKGEQTFTFFIFIQHFNALKYEKRKCKIESVGRRKKIFAKLKVLEKWVSGFQGKIFFNLLLTFFSVYGILKP